MIFRNKNTGGLYKLLFYNKHQNTVILLPLVWIKALRMTVAEFTANYEFISMEGV